MKDKNDKHTIDMFESTIFADNTDEELVETNKSGLDSIENVVLEVSTDTSVYEVTNKVFGKVVNK